MASALSPRPLRLINLGLCFGVAIKPSAKAIKPKPYFCCMKIKLLVVGKTDEKYLQEGIALFEKRLSRFIKFEQVLIPPIKERNISPLQQKEKAAEAMLKHIKPTDTVVVLDEKGDQHTSAKFASLVNNWMVQAQGDIVFVTGGPYGTGKPVFDVAKHMIAFGKGTYSHQLVRLIFMEQIYRAFTILNNHPYHNE